MHTDTDSASCLNFTFRWYLFPHVYGQLLDTDQMTQSHRENTRAGDKVITMALPRSRTVKCFRINGMGTECELSSN